MRKTIDHKTERPVEETILWSQSLEKRCDSSQGYSLKGIQVTVAGTMSLTLARSLVL